MEKSSRLMQTHTHTHGWGRAISRASGFTFTVQTFCRDPRCRLAWGSRHVQMRRGPLEGFTGLWGRPAAHAFIHAAKAKDGQSFAVPLRGAVPASSNGTAGPVVTGLGRRERSRVRVYDRLILHR